MSRNSHAYFPEIRQLLILSLLTRAGPNGLPPAEIRECLHDCYPSEKPGAIHRRFSDDMKTLRAAGLISYDHLRQSSMVKLAVPQKGRSLYLTANEHYTLMAARERLGWRSAPRQVGTGSGAPKLDLVLRALRLMEEQTSDVDDIAGTLKVRPAKIREVMSRLDGVRPQSELLTELVEIVRDGPDNRPSAGGVRFGSAHAPLEGRGLDEIGLFAYSRAEIDDRLALIAAALNHPDIPDADRGPLGSAADKLQRWLKKLAANQKRS